MEKSRKKQSRPDQPLNPPSTFFMRAIWKGSISFGLVLIPFSLFPATRREEIEISPAARE
jgi:hypothetical protein